MVKIMAYRCPECGKVFKDLKALRSHFIKIHRNNYCSLCKKRVKHYVMHCMKKKDDVWHLIYLVLIDGFSSLNEEERELAERLLVKMLRVEIVCTEAGYRS